MSGVVLVRLCRYVKEVICDSVDVEIKVSLDVFLLFSETLKWLVMIKNPVA